MRVMLTGAGGMLAHALRDSVTAHIELIALTRDQLDIGDRSQVERVVSSIRPHVIVNAAAYSKVDAAESVPQTADQVNGHALGFLAEAALRIDAKVVHFSSDYVFDGTASRPYDEASVTNPISAYGRSKLLGEHALRASAARHLIIRTQWLFGPEGRNFPAVMWSRARSALPPRVVNDQTGSPTYTPDLAAATWSLLDHEGTIHVVNAGSTTWYGVAQQVFRRAGAEHLLEPCTSAEYPTPAPRPAYSVLSTARLRGLRGDLPGWSDALDRYLEQIASGGGLGDGA